MREINLVSKKKINFKSRPMYFYEKDIAENIKSFIPGEWAMIRNGESTTSCIVNPFSKNTAPVTTLLNTVNNVEEYIQKSIVNAILKRVAMGMSTNARLVYGFEDGLPGLIADSYKNIVIVQINSAGFDAYRDLIKDTINKVTNKDIVFLDNQKYRENEGLPVFESAGVQVDVEVHENGIDYIVPKEIMQKVGYYYDHRVNRQKFLNTLQTFDKKFNKGIDLFCYVGSWGLHALKAGVKSVDFVDQANMESVVEANIKLNGHNSEEHKFYRSDVFKFLDEAKRDGKKYDCVISDPPAFTKSAKNRNKAIAGYEKLYQKTFKILEDESLLVVASCTQYVSMEDLDRIISKVSMENDSRVQLLDIGLQGWDHPLTGLNSKSNYIKYLLYYVEKV